MVELKPCPFCGEKAELYKGVTKHGLRYVFCPSCYATAGDNNESDEQAVEAWNTRAERRCRNVFPKDGILPNYPETMFRCSECGCDVQDYESYGICMTEGKWNFCPNCGAKVVE